MPDEPQPNPAPAKHPVDYHGALMAAGAAGAIQWSVIWQILQMVARFGWPVVSVIVPLFFQPNHGGYTIRELVTWAESAVSAEASGQPLPPLPQPSTPPAVAGLI